MENKYSFQEIDNEIRDSYLRTSKVFDERNKLRDNWNSLREWFEEKDNNGFEKFYIEDVLYKMNELEGGEDENN